MGDAAAIISALGVIISAWFAYNQYTKNKITDLKVERYKAQTEREMAMRIDQSGHIYGEIADLRGQTQADRVYIIQPHPLGNESLVSIYFEVKEKGVEAMKPHIQQLPLADIPKFYSLLTKNDYLAIHNIDNVDDLMAHSIFAAYGAEECYIQKMYNHRRDWNGSIFVEYTTEKSPLSEEDMQSLMKACASAIQYQIPEFKTV
jgi:hypothetical protein